MLYETDKDRENEEILAFAFELAGYKAEVTPTTWPYDIILYHNGKKRALVEYKCRYKYYDPLKVDVSKIQGLINAAEAEGVKPIFVTSIKPGPPYYWMHARTDYPIDKNFTRTLGDRGDKPDHAFEIPRSDFKML